MGRAFDEVNSVLGGVLELNPDDPEYGRYSVEWFLEGDRFFPNANFYFRESDKRLSKIFFSDRYNKPHQSRSKIEAFVEKHCRYDFPEAKTFIQNGQDCVALDEDGMLVFSKVGPEWLDKSCP